MAATVVAEKAKVFYLENEGISSGITGRGFKYTFRTTFDSDMMAYQMVDYAAEVIAPKIGEKGERTSSGHHTGGRWVRDLHGKGTDGQGEGTRPARRSDGGLQREIGRPFGDGHEAQTGET